jgi:hypothetical protein
MRQEWSPEELIERWTLLEADWKLVGNKSGATSVNGQFERPTGGQVNAPPRGGFSGLLEGRTSSLAGLSHPKGLAVCDHDDAVVQQPV